MQKKSFREDINGLRAIAVLSVVIFHFNNGYLPGGFAGVDVFFVISGYLMTSIIFRGIENNNFSILNFIISRAKRIIPALTIITLIILIIGFLLFEPLTYRIIGKHAASSLLFISNYIYSLESGYFDIGSHDKFFLHTWSLSVEWQFYVVYPIMLFLSSKIIPINFLKKIVVTIAVFSFITSITFTESNPSSAYFMLYTRAWEMMVGGIAFLYPLQLKKNKCFYIELIGLSLVFLSFFIVNDKTPWPGFMASIPVLGGYLCILANNKKSILSNRILQKIGLWSYSIYLVHWPVIVFLHKINIDINVFTLISFVMLISFLIYEFVEKKRNYSYGMMLIYMATLALSLYIKVDGIGWRISNDDYKLTLVDYKFKNEGHMGMRQIDGPQYINSSEDDFEYILIGSSHARHYYSYIKESNKKVVSFAYDGCNSTKNFFSKYDSKSCSKRYEMAVSFINSHPGKKVIWSARWDNWGDISGRDNKTVFSLYGEIISFIRDIDNSKSTITIVTEVPGTDYIAYECLAKKELPINGIINMQCADRVKRKESNFYTKIKDLTKDMKNVKIINTREFLCDDNNMCLVIKDGNPIYTDYNHLSKYGASFLGYYIFTD